MPVPLAGSLVDLEGAARERAIPIILDSFTGVYRWHAKRTLRTVPTVRAAEVGGTLVGVSLLDRLLPEVGYVYYIAVKSTHRRHGFGRELLRDALARFRSDGAEVVYAAVRAENDASRALFESEGFRVVERKETSFREGGLGAWGLRSRMWLVSGELLLGIRLAPARSPEGNGERPSNLPELRGRGR